METFLNLSCQARTKPPFTLPIYEAILERSIPFDPSIVLILANSENENFSSISELYYLFELRLNGISFWDGDVDSKKQELRDFY
jgi:hypothetical protein